MFRPQPMMHVEILLLQRDLSGALRKTAEAGILHLHRLEEAGTGEVFQEAPGRDLLTRYRDAAVLLRQIMDALGVAGGGGKHLDPGELSLWETSAAGLQGEIGKLLRRQQELERRRAYLGLLAIFLRRLSGLEGDAGELRHLRFAALRLGILPAAALAELVRGVRVSAYPLTAAAGGTLTAVLTVRQGEALLDRRLSELQFTPVPLPAGWHGPVADVRGRIRKLQQRIRQGQRRLERKLAELRRENGTLLRDRLQTVQTECRLLEAQEDFGFTGRAVAIGGWVPRRRYGELNRLLQRTCAGRFILRRAAARGRETPVLFANPFLIRPFQKILGAFGTPAYGEVEPTPLLALGFLVLFGMMFGDVGQGLVLAAAGIALRRWTRFRDEGLIVTQVGLFATLFGFLFGSVFGREDLFPPFWFSPMHDIPRLMTAALVLGAGLILAGLGLRIVNGLREERVWAVLTDRFGVAGLVFYAGSLVTGFLVFKGAVPAAFLAWLAAPLTAVFFHPFAAREPAGTGERLAEGAVEVLETVLGFLANTFSFLRVAAFGLAHVGLFMAIFAFADLVRPAPLGLFWAALVHLLGNIVVLLLEGLIVSVQTVRLEFYEIFSKFFRGGGVVYRPLVLESGAERRD